MLTFDKARKEAAITAINARQEYLRERMFGANGIKSFDALPREGTQDAAALAEFTRRMVEYIDLGLDKMDFPETTYRQVFTLKTNIPRGTDAWVKYEIEANGKSDWIDEEGRTTPMLAVGTIPNVRHFLPRGLGWRITEREILRATLSRMPIDNEKAFECRRIVEEGLDQVYWLGDSTVNIYGLLSHPNIPTSDATTGSWLTATALQIEQDILIALNLTMTATHMLKSQWDLALPESEYIKLTQTRLNDGTYQTMTIAQWLIQQIPQLRSFIPCDRLANAAADTDNLGVFIPVGAQYGYGIQAGDVQTRGPFQISMLGRDYMMDVDTAGFFTNKPLMFRKLEGI